MKLYRGDSIPSRICSAPPGERGRTFADHFCGTGLTSKFADNGSNALLRGKALLDMVLGHVGYERDEPEQDLSYRSPFLSFTEDHSSAFSFAERSGRKSLEECLIEDAAYFIWELDIDTPNESEPGHYEFLYRASSVNCTALVMGQIQRGREEEALTKDTHNLVMGLMNLVALVHADADIRDHHAELIDVTKYVENQDHNSCDHRLVDNTLERARQSREWLLYPMDPKEDGPGVSSRFHMNRHLRVYKCYRIRGGKPAGT